MRVDHEQEIGLRRFCTKRTQVDHERQIGLLEVLHLERGSVAVSCVLGIRGGKTRCARGGVIACGDRYLAVHVIRQTRCQTPTSCEKG